MYLEIGYNCVGYNKLLGDKESKVILLSQRDVELTQLIYLLNTHLNNVYWAPSRDFANTNSFNTYNNPLREVLLYQWGNWGTQGIINWPKVKGLVSGPRIHALSHRACSHLPDLQKSRKKVYLKNPGYIIRCLFDLVPCTVHRWKQNCVFLPLLLLTPNVSLFPTLTTGRNEGREGGSLPGREYWFAHFLERLVLLRVTVSEPQCPLSLMESITANLH